MQPPPLNTGSDPAHVQALCSLAGEAVEMLLDLSVPCKIALDCIVTEVAVSLYLA